MPVAAQLKLACMDAGRAASGTKAEESREAMPGCRKDADGQLLLRLFSDGGDAKPG